MVEVLVKILDIVSKKFGIDLANDPYFDNIDWLGDHPITNGLKPFNFISGGTLLVVPPVIGIAGNGSNIGVAVSEVGEGRVVAVGDMSFLENYYYSDEAGAFAVAVFNWLTRKIP